MAWHCKPLSSHDPCKGSVSLVAVWLMRSSCFWPAKIPQAGPHHFLDGTFPQKYVVEKSGVDEKRGWVQKRMMWSKWLSPFLIMSARTYERICAGLFNGRDFHLANSKDYLFFRPLVTANPQNQPGVLPFFPSYMMKFLIQGGKALSPGRQASEWRSLCHYSAALSFLPFAPFFRKSTTMFLYTGDAR